MQDEASERIVLDKHLFQPLPSLCTGDEIPENEEHIDELLAMTANLDESEMTSLWNKCGLVEPFLSCTKVGRREVAFEVTTNLCPGVTRSFKMTFIPGYPSRVCLLGVPPANKGAQITVRNGERLPSMTVACFDSFNNRTDPPAVWHFVLHRCSTSLNNFLSFIYAGKGMELRARRWAYLIALR